MVRGEYGASIDGNQVYMLSVLGSRVRSTGTENDIEAMECKVPALTSDSGILHPVLKTPRNRFPRYPFYIGLDIAPDTQQASTVRHRHEFSLNPVDQGQLIGVPCMPNRGEGPASMAGFAAIIGTIEQQEVDHRHDFQLFGQEPGTDALYPLPISDFTASNLFLVILDVARNRVPVAPTH